jgi:hypothetical protein
MKFNPIKMKVWKVVAEWDGMLCSASADIMRSNYNLFYHPLEITRPKIGKIFAFQSLPFATRFVTDYVGRIRAGFQIWEAESYGNEVAPEYIPEPWFIVNQKALQFWINHKLSLASVNYQETPAGSILCRAIKLTKRFEETKLIKK